MYMFTARPFPRKCRSLPALRVMVKVVLVVTSTCRVVVRSGSAGGEGSSCSVRLSLFTVMVVSKCRRRGLVPILTSIEGFEMFDWS